MPSIASNRAPAQVIPRLLALFSGIALIASTLVTWATVTFFNGIVQIKPVPGVYTSTVVPGYTTFKLFSLKEGWEIIGIGIAVIGVIAVAVSFTVRDNMLMGVCPVLGIVVALLGLGSALRIDLFRSNFYKSLSGSATVKIEPSTGFYLAAAAALLLILLPLIARIAGYRPPSHKVAFNERYGPDYSVMATRVVPERPAPSASEFVGAPPPALGTPPPLAPVSPSTGRDLPPLAPPTPPFGGVGQADTFVALPVVPAGGGPPAAAGYPPAPLAGGGAHPVPVPGPAQGGGTPAGWYPDPYNPAQQRYWSGAGWTGHTAPR